MNTTNYKQYDTRWNYLPYPTRTWNIGNSGCGEVAICNTIIDMLAQANQTPATIQPYCVQFAAPNGDGTYHAGIPVMMKHYGMTEVMEHPNFASLWRELEKGDRVAIYLMDSTPAGSKRVHWTSGGHFVGSVAYKYEDGLHKVYMKDSNSISDLRNGWISYEENIRGACPKVWSGKLSGSPAPTPTPTPTGKLVVDGVGGYETVKRLQEFLKLSDPDGLIGNQRASLKKWYPSLTAVKFSTSGGSNTVRALQKFLNLSDPDGILGKNTTGALQKKLRDLGYLDKSEEIDSIFGAKSMRALQTALNNDFKDITPSPTPTPTPDPKPYSGSYPTDAEIRTASNIGIHNGIRAWCKQIYDSGKYHYVSFTDDEYTHECPICHPRTYDLGWNCIGFAFASWRHNLGSPIPCTCNCGVIWNGLGDNYYYMSNLEVLKSMQSRIGITDIQLIRNDNNPIPASSLQVGDLLMFYSGKTYTHMGVYIGNGKIAHSANKNDGIRYGDSYSNYKCLFAIRYTGTRSYIFKYCDGDAVTKLQNYIDWYYDGAFFKECGKADGYYGDNTYKWTVKLQKDLGFDDPDGTVGAKTIAKMKEVKK